MKKLLIQLITDGMEDRRAIEIAIFNTKLSPFMLMVIDSKLSLY